MRKAMSLVLCLASFNVMAIEKLVITNQLSVKELKSHLKPKLYPSVDSNPFDQMYYKKTMKYYKGGSTYYDIQPGWKDESYCELIAKDMVKYIWTELKELDLREDDSKWIAFDREHNDVLKCYNFGNLSQDEAMMKLVDTIQKEKKPHVMSVYNLKGLSKNDFGMVKLAGAATEGDVEKVVVEDSKGQQTMVDISDVMISAAINGDYESTQIYYYPSEGSIVRLNILGQKYGTISRLYGQSIKGNIAQYIQDSAKSFNEIIDRSNISNKYMVDRRALPSAEYIFQVKLSDIQKLTPAPEFEGDVVAEINGAKIPVLVFGSIQKKSLWGSDSVKYIVVPKNENRETAKVSEVEKSKLVKFSKIED
jgi:hypothetical protein